MQTVAESPRRQVEKGPGPRADQESREVVERLARRAERMQKELPRMSLATLIRLLVGEHQSGRKTPL